LGDAVSFRWLPAGQSGLDSKELFPRDHRNYPPERRPDRLGALAGETSKGLGV
jgi:hypothetical protein